MDVEGQVGRQQMKQNRKLPLSGIFLHEVSVRSRISIFPTFLFFILAVSASRLASAAGQAPAQPPIAPSPAMGKQVVVTVDDLPGGLPGTDDEMGKLADLQRWNRGVIQALVKHHVPGLGLVIERKLEVTGERDARAAILNSWIDAGMELGNHTYSHVHFNQVTLQQYEAETLRGDVVTRALLEEKGRTEQYFRHPALNESRDAATKQEFRKFLSDHGYTVAPVTVEDGDYKFNDSLDEARRNHDYKKVDEIKRVYLVHALAMFDYVEDASAQLFHRQIPQVLLIHDSELNAEMLDQLLTALEQRGYRFVSLHDALQDPAYGPQEVSPTNLGTCYVCWGNRLILIGKQTSYPWSTEPDWIRADFERIRKLNTK